MRRGSWGVVGAVLLTAVVAAMGWGWAQATRARASLTERQAQLLAEIGRLQKREDQLLTEVAHLQVQVQQLQGELDRSRSLAREVTRQRLGPEVCRYVLLKEAARPVDEARALLAERLLIQFGLEDAVLQVTVAEGTAFVDLRDFSHEAPHFSASSASTELLSVLNAAVFEFEVDEAVYLFEGDFHRFGDFVQRGFMPYTRTEWEEREAGTDAGRD